MLLCSKYRGISINEPQSIQRRCTFPYVLTATICAIRHWVIRRIDIDVHFKSLFIFLQQSYLPTILRIYLKTKTKPFVDISLVIRNEEKCTMCQIQCAYDISRSCFCLEGEIWGVDRECKTWFKLTIVLVDIEFYMSTIYRDSIVFSINAYRHTM